MRDFPGSWRFMVACASCQGWSCEKHIHLMQSVEKRERTELKHTFHIIMQTSVYGVDLVSDLAGSNDAFAQESNFFFLLMWCLMSINYSINKEMTKSLSKKWPKKYHWIFPLLFLDNLSTEEDSTTKGKSNQMDES